MTQAVPSRLAAVAAVLLAMPAAAQTDAPAPGNPPSLVGSWSGVSRGAMEVPQAESFDADGTFTSVGRLPAGNGTLPAGFTVRVWGTYRATPAGPGQLRVEFQATRWSPRQICNTGGDPAPKCRPFDLPRTTDTVLVTFPAPDRLQSTSETTPGITTVETRDDHPALLQAVVPERWTYCSAEIPGACGSGIPHPIDAGHCDDLQQRRICAVTEGHLVRTPNGCLSCVAN